jgi:predicted transposase YbfD/YdcC
LQFEEKCHTLLKTTLPKGDTMNNVRPSRLYNSKKFAIFIQSIEKISDPRLDRRKKHPLVNIIVVIVFSMLGGANNPSEIVRFGKRHERWFRSVLTMEHGIPSHDTIGRALGFINPSELSHWLNFWIDKVHEKNGPKQIAIDGKEDHANQFHCLRALDVNNNMVLAHAQVRPGTNEITTAPILLRKLTLKNTIVSVDAIMTQKKIARQIINNGGDYVCALKRNHGQLYEDVKLYLDDIENNNDLIGTFEKYETLDKGHGRIEKRMCITTSKIEWLKQRFQWKHITSISCIERTRVVKGKSESGKYYFISSLNSDAHLIAGVVRNHWSIENQCHRHLDINFDSDHSTLSHFNAALNLAIFKDFALMLLQNTDSTISIKEKRIQNDHQFSVLLKTLLKPHF